MAINALRPFPRVLSAVNWEKLGVVVKIRRDPIRLSVAVRATCRELRRGMVRVRRLVVIRRVAARAGVRRIIVIAIMAGRTIRSDCCMRPI